MLSAETEIQSQPHLPPPQEVRIRALGVSLVAIAAIVASMTIVKQQRSEESPNEQPPPDPRTPAAVDPLNLEAIRSAGL